MSQDATERAAALASLLVGTTADVEGAGPSDAPIVVRTGREVEAGGDVARLLLSPAHLSYMVKEGRQYVEAVPGDVVLLPQGEADRLDALGVTVDPDADLDEVEEQLAEGLLTDEQIRTGKAEELVAYVAQHPDERDRVKALEEERGAKARSTVLNACELDPEAEAERELEALRRQEEAEQAAAQQGNDAPGADSDTQRSE